MIAPATDVALISPSGVVVLVWRATPLSALDSTRYANQGRLVEIDPALRVCAGMMEQPSGGFYSPPPPPLEGPLLAAAIRSEHAARVAAALAGKESSMLREAIYLQNLASSGGVLTADQQSDVLMFHAINAWETDMISARERLLASADSTYSDSGHWPAPPAGLAEFLTGY